MKEVALVFYNDDAGLAAGAEEDRIAVAGAAAQAAHVAAALSRAGFAAVLGPSGRSIAGLAQRLETEPPALVFNLCEAFRGESRLEAAIAALLEASGVPYTGNPPLALALCQDKALAKRALAGAGLPVARSAVLRDPEDPLPPDLAPPLFVKTRFEDASHGISPASVCPSVEAARARAAHLRRVYRQDVLVEEFLPGREFNIGVLFESEVLPLAEIDWKLPPGAPRVVTYEAKWVESSPYYGGTPVKCPAEDVPGPLAARLRDIAAAAFRTLGCRDYARVDIRLDGAGEPRILEVNPNPDLSPDAGLARAAARGGIPYDDLIVRIARAALARHGR